MTRDILAAQTHRQFICREAIEGEQSPASRAKSEGSRGLVVAAHLLPRSGTYVWGDGGTFYERPCFAQIVMPVPRHFELEVMCARDEGAARALFETALTENKTFGGSGVIRIEPDGRLAVEL